MRVAVIGAGAVGSSAARFLAKSGNSVDLYEQFTLGHNLGSSHGTSRIIRKSYPDPYYAALMEEVYPLWLDLQDEARIQLYHEVGLLIFGVETNTWLRETRASLIGNRIKHEALGPIEVAKRFAGFHLDPDEEAIFQPEAGYLRADQAITANLRIAQASGARIFEEHPVTEFREGTVDKESYDAIVVAAGSWTNKLIGTTLEPRLQHFAYFKTDMPTTTPVWIEACAEQFYGFPDYGRGAKVGQHLHGPIVDPSNVDREQDPEALDSIAHCATRRLGTHTMLEGHTCLYTVAPNEDFRIGRLEGKVPIFWASPCSGHGFKFSIWFGKLLKDLVEEKAVLSDYPRFLQ